MEINNFRRLDQEPVFPKYKKHTDIIGSIVGVIVWLFLVSVFLIVMYLYWFQKSLVTILQAFKPGVYKIPWWFSVLTFIFLMPLTLFVILAGTLIGLVKK